MSSSRHEGVSCDVCLKSYFRGNRYKCLICLDYDLCSSCYENGATTNRHTTDHPMQCILTRHDFDIFYGGEALAADQPQSLTCPFCGKMGFTEATLQEHVTGTHPDTPFQVVCPICASLSGDPNHMPDDFALHLTRDHWSGNPRDLDVSESGSRHGVRRVPHSGRGLSRGVTRHNMRFGGMGSGFFSSSRDSMDPIAELLSQLSGVRRATTVTRQQQQLPSRRGGGSNTSNNLTGSGGSNSNTATAHINVSNVLDANNISPTLVGNSATNANHVVVGFGSSSGSTASSSQQPAPTLVHSSSGSKSQTQSNFLLARLSDTENEKENMNEAHERASFVQELLLSTLSELSFETGDESGDFTSSFALNRFTKNLRDRESVGSPLESQSEKEAPTTLDVATQTTATIACTPSNTISPNPLSPFTSGHPLSKTTSTNSVLQTTKGSKVPAKPHLVTRSSPGLQALSLQPSSQNQSTQSNGSGRIVTGTGTVSIPGARGRPAAAGSVSPGSTRRKLRGVENRATQPPPPQ